MKPLIVALDVDTEKEALSLVKATMLGVVRAPSLFSNTFALAPSMIATQELVVPRSMPITFAMMFYPLLLAAFPAGSRG